MPIRKVYTKDMGSYFQWGKSGPQFYFTAGNHISRKSAKLKCEKWVAKNIKGYPKF